MKTQMILKLKHCTFFLNQPVNFQECSGDDCSNEECQECCDHDYDPNEGMMCIICGAEYPW